MEDILTVGHDRGPTWRKRALAAVAVAAAVGAVVIRFLPGDHHHAADNVLPTTVPHELVPRIVPGRGEAGGRQLRLMSGVQLPVAGPQPFWFWPASGRTEPIRGLPVTGGGYSFLRVAGGWALTRSTFARPACNLCTQAPLPVYFLPDRAGAARWAGIADAVAGAATAGQLWLTSYSPGDDRGDAGLVAREVGAYGRRVGAVEQLPTGYAIDGAAGQAWLLTPVTPLGRSAAFLLWKPGTGPVGRRPGILLAVNARQIAWMPRCARRCVVEVADVDTGQVTVIRQQAGETPISATFSPDGDYLAVHAGTRLYVASIRTGRIATVPATRASGDTLVAFGWPDDSDTLVTETSYPGKVRIEAWHPGAGLPEFITLEPGHGAAALVLG